MERMTSLTCPDTLPEKAGSRKLRERFPYERKRLTNIGKKLAKARREVKRR
jgi:hypothetical protein